MLWYDGSIENAISKVKSTGSFLVVFVQGNGSLSKEYESCLNKVTELKEEAYVALKLSHDSVALQLFQQIYVKVPIPSLFLIQNNGIPFDIVATDNISELNGAISKSVIQMNEKFEKENEVKNENSISEPAKKSLEEPLKRLERKKNIGHKIVNISEDELKQRLNEIRAFPRFLLINPSDLDPVPIVPEVPVPQLRKTHSARIQFRLPNNETPSWEFPDLSTLKDVRSYITEKMNLSPNFKFMRTYPRSAFTPRDESKTLSDLSLTPSATLIVVPVSVEDKKIQASPGDVVSRPLSFSTVVNTLLLPLFALIKFFKKHIFRERADIGNEGNGPADHVETVPRTRSRERFGSNIHGFKFDRDDSDEHPDNGNSTQQSYKKK